MSKRKSIRHQHLSAEAGELFENSLEQWAIDDPVGHAILLQACEALDRVRQAQAILRKQGLEVRDKNGIARPHPAVNVERTARQSMLAAFRALGLQAPKETKR